MNEFVMDNTCDAENCESTDTSPVMIGDSCLKLCKSHTKEYFSDKTDGGEQ